MESGLSDKVKHIHSELRGEIMDGKWPVGEKIPRELELAKRFGCSAGTVNKAVGLLVHEGLVVRRNRMGTRVVRNTTKPSQSGIDLDAFAFIYPSERHEGIWRTVQGFQEAANEKGRRVVMLSTGVDYSKEIEYLRRLSDFDVRGAAVYPYVPSPSDLVHISQRLLELKFPVVLVDRNLPGLGCSSVTVDGFHAGSTMTKYLIDKGEERIGFFADNAWASNVVDRYRGYKWALDQAGLPFDEKRVCLEPSMEPNMQDPLRQPTILGHRFLEYTDCSAVVCINDYLALGLMRAAHERGISTPEQLKIVGIDDFGQTPSEGPALTTYRVPFEHMGRLVFNVLDNRIAGRTPTELETFVRGEIVIRESA